MRIQDKIQFFVPVSIHKGKEIGGKKTLRVCGVASTAATDLDGENLDPSGFDLTKFLNQGFINWNHQAKTNPDAIIGEPTQAVVRNNELYLEGVLYGDRKIARDTYELAEALEKNPNSTRRLGWSIEGYATERDLKNPLKVKRAVITNVAITPMPKNPGTLVSIMKGEVANEPEYEANGGQTLLIDITDEKTGRRVTVDKDFNIKIISKSLSTDSGRPLLPESLNKSPKSALRKDDKGTNFTTTLTKGDIISLILDYTQDPDTAQQIFHFINEKGIMNKITKADLEKALTNLGFGLPKDNTELEKGSHKEPDGDEDEEGNEPEEDLDDEQEDEDEIVEKPAKKTVAPKVEESKQKKAAPMMKGVDSEVFEQLKQKNASLESRLALLERRNARSITKGVVEPEDDRLVTGFSSTGVLLKGVLESLDSLGSKMNSRLTDLENMINEVATAPFPQKSQTKLKTLQKGFDSADGENGGKELSLTRDRQAIVNILNEKSNIEKGAAEYNEYYGNAAMSFEATRTLPAAIIKELKNEGYTVVQ